MKSVILKPHKEESLLRFHPWVFSGAIARFDEEPEEGELVVVRDCKNHVLGVGHNQIGSIAVRILEFGVETLSENFWRERLQKSYVLRKSLGLVSTENNAYRLVHGEGDFLPGLIVDIYGETAVVQAHSVGMHYCRNMIAEELINVVDGVKNVYYKSETTLPFKAPIPEHDRQDCYLIGESSTYIAKENGLKFYIDWLRGQKTGFFLDQRENRSLLEKYAGGRKVLNMFCYTGGFSVYAMRGGARRVVSVDSSAKAVEIVDKNVSLNFEDVSRQQSVTEDAFRYLDNMEDDFDLIILDPPAFAKHRDAIRNALQGYTRLNAKAFAKIKSGGILFTFSCSQAIDKEMFRLAVFTAAAQAKRKVRILHQLTQPIDHPISIYHPEGEYLKGLVLWVE